VVGQNGVSGESGLTRVGGKSRQSCERAGGDDTRQSRGNTELSDGWSGSASCDARLAASDYQPVHAFHLKNEIFLFEGNEQ
jgi:hypothetical protein